MYRKCTENVQPKYSQSTVKYSNTAAAPLFKGKREGEEAIKLRMIDVKIKKINENF
jgi:hypothetical protein